MNSMRSISRKIDAMLLMIIAGLILGLALAWSYYQNRKMTNYEKETFAASLLAYSLPSEAATVIENTIRRQPLSQKSLKMRKVLSEIYMNELNDFEKALAELVFIRNFAPDSDIASGTETSIRYCLNRLGRVYDVERRKLLDSGHNPVKNTIASNTVVRFGDKHALGLDEIKLRLSQANNGEVTKELVDSVVSGLTQELLLARAADRENIKHNPDFVEQVRKFEKSLAINFYIQKNVLNQPKMTEEKQRELLGEAINNLAKQEEMHIDRELIEKELLKKESSEQ